MHERDEIAPLIPWYVNATLSKEDRARVDSHLPSCPECRELLELGRIAFAAAPAVFADGAPAHVDDTLLHDLVFDPHLVERSARARAERHIDDCSECSRARDELTELRTELGHERPSFRDRLTSAVRSAVRAVHRTPGLSPALAGAVVLVLLALPAYRGLYELPARDATLRELQTENIQLQADVDAASAGGLIDILYLDGPTRSGPAPTVSILPGKRYVLLAPVLDKTAIPQSVSRVRVEVRRGPDVVWSTSIESDELRRLIESDQGTPIIQVPAAALTTGSYTIIVAPEAENEPWLFQDDLRVEVSGSPPPPAPR